MSAIPFEITDPPADLLGTSAHAPVVQPDGARFAPRAAGSDSDPAADEETLVVDDRSLRSPAQVVEDRLSRMLKGGTVPVSHLQTRGLIRRR
jgi:hypothetical protein